MKSGKIVSARQVAPLLPWRRVGLVEALRMRVAIAKAIPVSRPQETSRISHPAAPRKDRYRERG